MGGFFGGGGASVANMVGATSSAAGTAGLVPAPASGKEKTFLRGDATFADISAQAIPTTKYKRSGKMWAVGMTEIGTKNSAANYVFGGFVYIPKNATYTTMSIEITSAGAANSKGKLALYDLASTGLPNNLLANTGEILTDSTGIKTGTFASSARLDVGWYFGAIGTDGAPHFRGTQYAGCSAFLRGIEGAAFGNLNLDGSTTVTYANLWPNPATFVWGSGTIYHPIFEVSE